jgi:hypothetical protein
MLSVAFFVNASPLARAPSQSVNWNRLGRPVARSPVSKARHHRHASRARSRGLDRAPRTHLRPFNFAEIRMLFADLLLWLGGLIAIVPVLALVRPMKNNPYYI